MTDVESIRQDLVDTQNKLLAISEDIKELDNKRAQAMAEIQANQGVARFLLDKIPADERAELINSLQTETEGSAQDDS
jgi:GTP-binding protein EngB required for normal cell division|tara:strand:- start:149 stop:382 length:234 start_codon:yes stop_codon:yes gene_type:complete